MKINATGIANKSSSGEILDVFFPIINFNGKNLGIDLKKCYDGIGNI